jgi:mediator of RNA polymerase II transcription subunit 17, fungi type
MASLTLKPWTQDAPAETSLKDVLARVSVERGHFRGMTEASLQEEMAGEGALELSDSEDEDEEDEGAEKDVDEAHQGKPSTFEELFNARKQMIRHVEVAINDVLTALDFVSLLHSKQNAIAASVTLSPALKLEVPMGTLGTDIWRRMPHDAAREQQDEALAQNVRFEGIQQSADSLLAAANRLQDNVRKETQYWDKVLSVSHKGWNVCRVPGQRHTLGVTYGFQESGPEFSRRSIAALRSNEDGEVTLTAGFASKPQALRVLLKREGRVVGASRIPEMPDGTADELLELKIRGARDSLFDEELYHEMLREARSHANLGIKMLKTGIAFQPDSGHTETVFELVSLDDDPGLPGDSTHQQDNLAQATALAARLLLSQAYRDRQRKRMEIPRPMTGVTEKRPELPILRPIMSFMLHQAAVGQVNHYLTRICTLLSKAKVDSISDAARLTLKDTAVKGITTSESLVQELTQPFTSSANLVIEHVLLTSAITLEISISTTLNGSYGSVCTLTSSSSSIGMYFDSFPDLRSAADSALSCSLAQALAEMGGDEWVCEREEAVLSKKDGEGANGVWVALDSETGELGVRSAGGKEVKWSLDGEDDDDGSQDLWSKWEEVVR